MGKNPASQFYWGDWLNDVELQSACSVTRGIWANALARMWFSRTKGEITASIERFPGLLVCTKEEFDIFISEAELFGFCDIKRNGTEVCIINRRMVRDERDKELTKKRQQRFRDKGGGDPDRWTSIRIKILERDEYICAYCGKKARTVDHIKPRSKGGNEDDNNLVACCTGCNQKKNNRTLEEAGMSFWKGFNQSSLKSNAKVTPPSSSSPSSSTSKKEKKEPKTAFRPNVLLTEKEYDTLRKKYNDQKTKWMLDKLSIWKEAKGQLYKSDYAAINMWVVKAYEKEVGLDKPHGIVNEPGGLLFGSPEWKKAHPGK